MTQGFTAPPSSAGLVDSTPETASDRQTEGPGGPSLEQLLQTLSAALRAKGFWASRALFSEFARSVEARAHELDPRDYAELLELRRRRDAIGAADCLDGSIAPALGLAPLLRDVSGSEPPTARDGRQRWSRLDPATEATLQMRANEIRATDAVAVLGGAATPLVARLAAVETDQSLWLWDPWLRSGDEALAPARPIRRIDTRSDSWPSVAQVILHPSLSGAERQQALRVRARLWRARLDAARSEPTSAPSTSATRGQGAQRWLVLVRPRPFHLEAPIVAELRRAGFAVAVAEVHGDDRDDLLARAVIEKRPDRVLSVNAAALATSPSLRAALEVAAVPIVLWFVDDPTPALGAALDLARDHVLAFAWERQAVARLRALGFTSSHYLPHGTRFGPSAVSPLPNAPELLWIGSSYAGADRRRLHSSAPDPSDESWAWIEERMRVDPRLAVSALRDARGIGSDAEQSFHQLRVLDRLAAERRSAVARALLPLGLTIFGDVDGWRGLLGAHAPLLEDVDAVTVVPHLVAGARISIDCAHPQMPTAVTQRVFDVPACGGLVLADDRPDLREHFDVGSEVLSYESPEDAAELAGWWLAHPDARQRMAAAAAARVAHQHRLAHRIGSMRRTADLYFGR